MSNKYHTLTVRLLKYHKYSLHWAEGKSMNFKGLEKQRIKILITRRTGRLEEVEK